MRVSFAMTWLLVIPTLLPAQQTVADPLDFAALEGAYTAARDAWTVARRAASAAGDEAESARLNAARPEAVFAPRFLAAAERLAGEAAAARFLVWIVQHGNTSAARDAMTTLMTSHVASADIRLAVARLGGLRGQLGLDLTRGWLDRVIEANEHPDVLAQAHFTRAGLHVGTRAAKRSDELRQLAISDLQFAIEHAEGDSLRGLAERLLDEAQRLEPGLTAPEIEAADLDGVAFKLSDYRGKVVLLDFWGDW